MEQLSSDELFVRQESSADVIRKPEDNNGIRPYWNPFVRDISEILWVPPFSLSGGLADMTLKDSWFSAVMGRPAEQGITAACFSLFSDSSYSGGPKTRKIRIYPDEKQKSLLRQWFGTARFVYNLTVAYLRQPDTRANWFGIKTGIIAGPPEWAKPVPYQIKSVAVRDACIAVKNAKMKYEKAGEFGTRVVGVCGAYTSKTCSVCGRIHNIGSEKVMKCGCGTVLDRDVNGARGIFLRALGDTPSLSCKTECAFVNRY